MATSQLQTPSDYELELIAENIITYHVCKLADALELSPGTLSRIRQNCSDNPVEIITRILRWWKERQSECSGTSSIQRFLAEDLSKAGRKDLSEVVLKSKHDNLNVMTSF